MKTSIEFETKSFSQNLQRELQTAFDCNTIRVKYSQRDEDLKILIQQEKTELFQDRLLSHVHQMLQKLLPEHIGDSSREMEARTGITTVRLYLQVIGEARPYNAKIISIQKLLQPVSQETTIHSQTSSSSNFAETEASEKPDSTASDENPMSEHLEPETIVPTQSTPTQSTPTQPTPIKSTAIQPVAATTTQLSTSEQPSSPNRWKRLKIAAVSTVAIATGMLAYGLTRPCVIGSCPLIAEAQEAESEALELLRRDSSAEDVITAYDRIIEANYSLNSIPFWSQYHDQAQILLEDFQTDADLVSKIVSAQRLAREAAITTQNPPHPIQVWEEVQGQWQEAIAKLNSISGLPIGNDLVSNKLADYQVQLAQVKQRIEEEQAAQEKIAAAREAVQLAEAREGIARSLESWQLVHVTWQVAMNRLQEVSDKTMAYAEAQQLAAIYESRLTTAHERKIQEELSSSTYSQALTLAEQAMNLEQRGQWSEAVAHWKYALTHVDQVPIDTSYSDQARSLLKAYDEALGQAEQQASTAMAAEQIRPVLEQNCGTTPSLCTIAIESNTIGVYLEAGYESFVQQAMLSGGVSISSGYAETTKAATLLQAIANAGDIAQNQVEVYNSAGNLIGTYMPELRGYVQPQVAITADQENL